MKKSIFNFILLVLSLVLNQFSAQAVTRYVKTTGTGSGSGASWATASNNLQAIINASASGDEVWVAQGNYQLASGVTFNMKANVAIYGGFFGTETVLSQRNWRTNVTTLRGNNNCVFYNNNNGLTSTAILDGFTISNGNANSGAGMYNIAVSPTIRNCVFSLNTASGFGGGMYNITGSSPTIFNCVFSNNSSGFGGGVYNTSSSPSFTNCVFSGNTGSRGAGIYNISASPSINNCVFNGNTGGLGAGISNANASSPVIKNSIIYGNLGTGGVPSEIYIDATTSASNPLVSYSDIQGGYVGTGNINSDPLFFNASNPIGPDGRWGTVDDGFTLQSASPCKNTGDNASVPLNVTIDFIGLNRILDTTVDMGPYERRLNATYYVDLTKTSGANDGTSWANAYTYFQTALNNMIPGDVVWVAQGAHTLGSGASFSMKPGVTIYGGFTGNETNLNQRNWGANPTVLQGNGSSVVSNYGLTANAVLDGFVIMGGSGAGYGGGMLNNNASPTIRNCVFTANSTNYSGYGGGMSNISSSPTIINCVFSGNTATWGFGGGIANDSSSPTIINCVITGNVATTGGNGGGIYNVNSSSPTIVNSIVYFNRLDAAANEIYNANLSVPVFSYCDIRGGYAGTGNINSDPLFVNAANPAGNDGKWCTADDGLALQSASPCKNIGSNAAVPSGITSDVKGNVRIQETTVDIGPYEFGTTLGTNDFGNYSMFMRLFPNPATSELNIVLENELKSVEIYSVQGQKVFETNTNSFTISGLANGMYMVRVEDENGGVATQKIVKQ